jgi:hypothetical protein
MFLKRLKITGKLILSAAAFCVPFGIILFLIISSSYNSIQKGNREPHGIETIRPAVSLLQIVPKYTSMKLDNTAINDDRALYIIELFGNFSF